MLRRIWNGPGLYVIALAIIVTLVVVGWSQYRAGQHSVDRYADCLVRAESTYEMKLCDGP